MTHAAEILLVSNDDGLASAVRQAADLCDSVFLHISGPGGVKPAHLEHKSLIVFHAAGDGDGSFAQFLDLLGQEANKVPLVVICDEYCSQLVTQIWEAGARDVFSRPLNIGRLSLAMKLLARPMVGSALSASREDPARGRSSPLDDLLAEDMEATLDQIHKASTLNSTILLTGETGTGKTTVARWIHNHSPRHREAFTTVNCGTLTPTLIESELFGHAKGAFTGATEDRIGKLAAVGEGTIFLDEVDSLSLESQARLLRVADERVFEPVGSNAIVKCHARIIAATSRSLRDAVQMRQFRNDLYYRLNVIAFELPPLRQRRNLISRLTERWLQDYADAANRPIPTLNEEVRELLQDYHWPGNIRELRNVIERVTVLCTGGVIRPEDLPPDLATSVSAEETSQHVIDGSLHEVREKAEVSAILNALTRNKGNRTRAAEDLGVSRVTLHKKIREYGLRTA